MIFGALTAPLPFFGEGTPNGPNRQDEEFTFWILSLVSHARGTDPPLPFDANTYHFAPAQLTSSDPSSRVSFFFCSGGGRQHESPVCLGRRIAAPRSLESGSVFGLKRPRRSRRTAAVTLCLRVSPCGEARPKPASGEAPLCRPGAESALHVGYPRANKPALFARAGRTGPFGRRHTRSGTPANGLSRFFGSCDGSRRGIRRRHTFGAPEEHR